MSKIPINVGLVAAELFGAGDALKSAIFVSVAALLSRTSEDLEANAATALSHLDDLGRRIDGVRNAVSQASGVTLVAKVTGKVREIDGDALTEALSMIDDGIEASRNNFDDVLQSNHRDGADLFADRICALGHDVQAAIEIIVGPGAGGPALLFDTYYAEAMRTLAAEDWGTETSN